MELYYEIFWQALAINDNQSASQKGEKNGLSVNDLSK